jgi:WD40 repeat protein
MRVVLGERPGHKDRVFKVAVNPIDGSVASGSNNRQIRTWNGTTGMPIRA